MRRLLFCIALAACGTPDPLLPPPVGFPEARLTEVYANGRPKAMRAGWRAAADGIENTASGLRCPEEAGGGRGAEEADDVLRLASAVSYVPDGSDASCTYAAPRAGAVVTVYATIAALSGAAFLADGEAAIAARYPGAEAISLRGSDLPGFVGGSAYALPAGTDGKTYDRVTAIWVASQGDRHVKVRATYPAARAYAETQAERVLRAAARDVQGTD